MITRTIEIAPSAIRLASSLRDIGYDFPSAIADLVDNSVEAAARKVGVWIDFRGAASRVLIVDDGAGMNRQGLNEALRFGTRRTYPQGALGKFGLGLKTASLSQARRVTVASRINANLSVRRLDLDRIAAADRWEVSVLRKVDLPADVIKRFGDSSGTLVLWEHLDRVMSLRNQEGAWAKRRLEKLAEETRLHLGMVFHRYLEGKAGTKKLRITVNGRRVEPWDPLASAEAGTELSEPVEYSVATDSGEGWVRLQAAVLPPRERFSSLEAFERASGPLRWNRQQGFYIYRSNRMIQAGGWSGLRTTDEHTKLARVALDFDPGLDESFHVNVTKMRASLPLDLRAQIDDTIGRVCRRAQTVYRHGLERPKHRTLTPADVALQPVLIAMALEGAADDLGLIPELTKIMARAREVSPEVANQLGF